MLYVLCCSPRGTGMGLERAGKAGRTAHAEGYRSVSSSSSVASSSAHSLSPTRHWYQVS